MCEADCDCQACRRKRQAQSEGAAKGERQPVGEIEQMLRDLLARLLTAQE